MRLAVLGLGSIGRRHASNLMAAGHTVIGFDPDPQHRATARAAGALTEESRGAALATARAAVIASPSQYHLEDLRACVEADCHVFVEKPLAHTTQGLQPILDRAVKNDLVIYPGLNLRFHPCVRVARELIRNGGIGRVLWARMIAASYLPEWRKGVDYRQGYAANPLTGGVLFDIIHEFDLAIHLLGPAQTRVALATRSGVLEMASEDNADVILTHDNGVRTTLHLDYITRPAVRETEIQGTGGRLCLDIAGRGYRHLDLQGQIVAQHNFDDTFDRDYQEEMNAFIKSIEHRTAPACSAQEALAVLQLVLSARAMAGLPGA